MVNNKSGVGGYICSQGTYPCVNNGTTYCCSRGPYYGTVNDRNLSLGGSGSTNRPANNSGGGGQFNFDNSIRNQSYQTKVARKQSLAYVATGGVNKYTSASDQLSRFSFPGTIGINVVPYSTMTMSVIGIRGGEAGVIVH